MTTQTFDIKNIELRLLHDTRDITDSGQLTVREYISINKLTGDSTTPTVLVGDAMIQKQATGFKHAFNRLEVGTKIVDAHMLKHTDADDAIVIWQIRQVAIISQLNLHLVFESHCFDSLLCEPVLRIAQSNPMGSNTVMARSPEDQRTPTTTYVQ